jgi:hypothetical protein
MMTRRKRIAFGFTLGLCSVVSWYSGREQGRGPAITPVKIVPLGPGRAGGVLPLLVSGSTRDGCIPLVARSISRWVINPENKLQLIKEPLTNVPMVAHNPPPPADLAKQYKVDARKIVPLFLPTGIPFEGEFGRSVTPWMLSTDASPLACGIEEFLRGMWKPNVVGAHDIEIEILPAVSSAGSAPAGAEQARKG